MRAWTRAAIGCVVIATAPGRVHADERSDASPSWWLGGHIELIPVASFNVHQNSPSMDIDFTARPAYGLGAELEHRMLRVVTIGFAPRIALGLEEKGDPSPSDSGYQIDLRGRIGLGTSFGDDLHAEGIGYLGYSWIEDIRFTAQQAMPPLRGLSFGIGARLDCGLAGRK